MILSSLYSRIFTTHAPPCRLNLLRSRNPVTGSVPYARGTDFPRKIGTPPSCMFAGH